MGRGDRRKKAPAKRGIARSAVYCCIATGPSLTRADCEAARKAAEVVIVVNDAWRLCPDADILYACDRRWWEHHLEAVKAGFHGALWTQDQSDDDADGPWARSRGINVQRGREARGLGRDVMHYGGNSGYQGINLAYLMGAGSILLLGYDMSVGPAGERHFFGNHPGNMHTGSDYTGWLPNFAALAADLRSEGVDVTNCTRRTALTCFPRGEL